MEFSFVIFGGYVLRIFWLVDVLWNFRLIFWWIFSWDILVGGCFVEFSFLIFGGYVLRIFWCWIFVEFLIDLFGGYVFTCFYYSTVLPSCSSF